MRALTVAFSVGVALLVQVEAASADFRADLARRLNIADPQYLIMNLPPRPACLPGAVFSSDLRTKILSVATSAKGYERGPEFSFSTAIDIEGSAGADVSGAVLPFALAAEDKGSYSASLTIAKAHVLEIAGPGIQSVLRKLSSSVKASAPAPAMIQRAYEGVFTLKLTAKAGVNASATQSFWKKAVDVGAKAKMEGSSVITFESPGPVVFAFEIARITDFVRLTKAARDLEEDVTTPVTKAGSRASSNVIMGADVPSEAPSVAIGSSNRVKATVGAVEVREHAQGQRMGSATGYVRVPAFEFERVNSTPGPVVK